MDVYNKSYYICNEVMMGLSIFSNYIGIAEIIGLIKKTTFENYDFVQMQ